MKASSPNRDREPIPVNDRPPIVLEWAPIIERARQLEKALADMLERWEETGFIPLSYRERARSLLAPSVELRPTPPPPGPRLPNPGNHDESRYA